MTSATLDGITYDEVNTLSARAFAEIGFSSTHLLPPLRDSTVLRTPFTMEGYFSHPGGIEMLVGSGIVTTNWFTSGSTDSGSRVWNLASARYNFSEAAPVPEPGTMMLVGLGGAAAQPVPAGIPGA